MKNLIHSVLLCVVLSTIINGFSVYDMSKNHLSVKSLGMGTAYTAFAEGEAATLLNPAALSYPGSSYSFQQLDYDKLDYNLYQAHYYYNNPIGISSVIKEDFQGNKLTMNSVGLGAFSQNGVSWGVNYKSIFGNYDNQSVKGWSSDLGVLIRLYPGLNAGFLIQDIYSKDLNLNTTFKGALAGFLNNNLLGWSLEVSYDNQIKKVVTTSFGTEFLLSDTLVFRSGINKTALFSGASLQLPFVNLEFGIKNDLQDLKGNYYSTSFKFGRGSDIAKFRKRYALFKRSAYAEMVIGGNVQKGKSEVSLLGGYKIGSNDLLKLIHHANQDSSCRGYIIRIGNFRSSLTDLGLVQEIRDELLKSKEFDKKIIVYLEGSVGLPEYYLASLADLIVMPPLGTLSQFGIDIEVRKASDFFEKLGIHTTVFTSGKHKASTDLFSDSLTDLDREHLNYLISDLFQDVKDQIKVSRQSVSDAIERISDGSMITAKDAKEMGLVDRLAYWPDVYSIVDNYDSELEKLNLTDFMVSKQPSMFHFFNRIAVLEVDGSIVNGNNSSNFIFGGKATGAEEFDRLVDKVSEDDKFKGVILRVNSPGGSVLASDRIYTAIERLKSSGKKVYTSMGSIATSGGYYVAANSDKIYANASSITGSIGVVSSFRSYSKLGDEIGVQTDSIKTGKFMDMYSSLNELDNVEEKLIKNFQDNFYQEFVYKVKSNRRLTDEEAYTVSQGQLYTGKQAQNMRIIDDIGGFYDVVDDLANDLNIEDPDVVFIRSSSSFRLPFGNATVKSQFYEVISSFIPMLGSSYLAEDALQFDFK
ncbi:MAG: signal peptide peptidase SppA [Actinobacteria bacterium]|nr:signal peptide peptidase SppA [Actinomycetota bacterium]|tara:strand:- start:4083 stop:6509 length:2427 start_codon:yes stop_codon:yes gene_type:complete